MGEESITLTINGQKVSVPKDTTILDAAKKLHINIPTLCYSEELPVEGACRVCVVEIEGRPRLEPACATQVAEEMKVKANSSRVRTARKLILELLLASHPEECTTCERSQKCELEELAYNLGVREVRFEKVNKRFIPDLSSPSLIRDPNKCILCGRCVRMCREVQSVRVIDFANRGESTEVTTAFGKGINDIECTTCGLCILVCPTGALQEKSTVDEVWKALADPSKYVVVQTAPAVRVAIGEEFGMKAGSLVTGKMTAALRRLGFDKVFDTQFGADFTVNEEANEFLERVRGGGKLPMITSCCSGWVKYIEHFFPECLGYLTTCRSPQQMFGPIAKTYYAEKTDIDPRDLYVVSTMPCTAKKFEARRPEMCAAFEYWRRKGRVGEDEKFPDVDAVLTTREAARMIKEVGIDFPNLPAEEFDTPLGISTGAGTIFGVTGGMMEATLRTAYEWYTGKTLGKVEFEQVRGMKGTRTASISMDGLEMKVAIAHGLNNARVLLEEIQQGKSPYHFIEVMACPGGCLGGGGQPVPTNSDVRAKRADSLYIEDKKKSIRKSHENPVIQVLYKEFLGEPGSEKAHHLLHTTYTKRGL